MDNPNQMQPLEAGATIKMVCTLPSNSMVCISRGRYDDMLRAEMQRDILLNAYQRMGTFNMEPVMDSVFNPKLKHQKKATTSSEAGAGDAE